MLTSLPPSPFFERCAICTHQLTWDFTVKAEQAIASALANFRNRIEDISLHVTSHAAYGKVCARGAR